MKENPAAGPVSERLSWKERARLVGIGVPKLLALEGIVIGEGALFAHNLLGALFLNWWLYTGEHPVRVIVTGISKMAEAAEEIKSGIRGRKTAGLHKIRKAHAKREKRWAMQDKIRRAKYRAADQAEREIRKTAENEDSP